MKSGNTVTSYCFCGNTIKTQTQYSTSCGATCSGKPGECCGDLTGVYYSVYSNSNILFL